MVAYVYLLEEVPYCEGESGPWTKIGYSKNPPEWRLNANLKRGNPRDLRFAAVFEFKSEKLAHDAEKSAHHHFSQLAHQKEWFRVSSKDVADWFIELGSKKREA
jgi:hypothetical protein